MDEKNFQLAGGIISKSYVQQAAQAKKQRESRIKDLLAQRRLLEDGWDDLSIELLLAELAGMDSNNFLENVGVGEREGRVFSGLVARRNYNLSHGIGRSGEISAEQPKAAGSSLMYKLTHRLALDACRLAGLQGVTSCLLLPLATGMAMTTTLLALRQSGRCRSDARYVIWPRIDQKSCLKAVLSAGLTPLVVENRLEGDELRTDLEAIERLLDEHGTDSVVCVVSTSSCFAPRAPDRVVEIAQLCKRRGVCHLVNNAYGLQSSKITHLLSESIRVGRVDAIVQSTDKNFMVPVGGALVVSPDASFIDQISRLYPGRASSGPVLDLFITLLSMGAAGYKRLLAERKELFGYFTGRLAELASAHGERLLSTPNNPISFCMSLATFSPDPAADGSHGGPTYLGSMLFSRFVSGTRTVAPSAKATSVGPLSFRNYGAHHDAYPVPYLSAACAIGMSRREVDVFLQRLDRVIVQYRKSSGLSRPTGALPVAAPAGTSPASVADTPPAAAPTASAAARLDTDSSASGAETLSASTTDHDFEGVGSSRDASAESPQRTTNARAGSDAEPRSLPSADERTEPP